MNFSWQGILFTVAAVQFLAIAIYSASSRAKFAKRGLRRSEQWLIASSGLVVVAAVVISNPQSFWSSRTKVTQSAAVSSTPRASCATVAVGMSESQVTSRMGAPDRRLADEETRGPGAAILVYESSRCAVHLFGGRVELVE
jgi:hypothetical protein